LSSQIEYCGLGSIVSERSLLLFRSKATIYGEIMQHMKNATKQRNTPAWHRRRANRSSAAAVADHQKSAPEPVRTIMLPS